MKERVEMNKDELISRTAAKVRENAYKKPLPVKKHTFTITDSEGTQRSFTIKDKDKEVFLNRDDVGAVLLAAFEVIKDAMSEGDPIYVRGFGRFGLIYRKPRASKEPLRDVWHSIPGRWIVKFSPGVELSECARRYEMSLLQQNTDLTGLISAE